MAGAASPKPLCGYRTLKTRRPSLSLTVIFTDNLFIFNTLTAWARVCAGARRQKQKARDAPACTFTLRFAKTNKSRRQKVNSYDIKPVFQGAFSGQYDLC